MNKLLSLFLGLMLVFPLAFADAGGKDCDRGAKMAEKLNLQEDQVESVKKIMEEQHEKRRTVYKEHHEAMKKSMSDLHNETRERLSSVLTPEQLEKFDDMHKQKMERMKQHAEKWKKRFKDKDSESGSEDLEAI